MLGDMSASHIPAVPPVPAVPAVIFDLDGLEAAHRLGAEPADCVVLEDAVPGAVAAHAAGMRCIAIPYVPDTASDPAFGTAGLLFAGGQREFTARAAYAWLSEAGER
jgi:hypothetical protein